jgi:hypothetical protein
VRSSLGLVDPAVTTGLFTLLASFGGLYAVRLTLQHGRRLRERDREERGAVVEGALNGEIIDSAKRHGRSAPEPIGRAWGFFKGYKQQLEELERRALQAHSPPVLPPTRSTRRRRPASFGRTPVIKPPA